MITDIDILSKGKNTAQIYALMCGVSKEYIDDVCCNIYDTKEKCIEIVNALQKYFIDGVYLGGWKKISNERIIKFGIQRLHFPHINPFRDKWVVGVEVMFENCSFSNNKRIHIFPAQNSTLREAQRMIWRDDYIYSKCFHDVKDAKFFTGHKDDTEGHIRVKKEVNGRTELYGDWWCDVIGNHYNSRAVTYWYNNECVFGYYKLYEYLNSLEDVTKYSDVIVGETYEVDNELTETICNFNNKVPSKLRLQCDSLKTIMNKTVIVVDIENERDFCVDDECERWVEVGLKLKDKCFYCKILPCMLKKKNKHQFSEYSLKVLNNLLCEKKIYIQYKVINGGGMGKYYELSDKNTYLTLYKNEERVHLPWGELSVENVEKLLICGEFKKEAPWQNDNSKRCRKDGSIEEYYCIKDNIKEFEYDAERV